MKVNHNYRENLILANSSFKINERQFGKEVYKIPTAEDFGCCQAAPKTGPRELVVLDITYTYTIKNIYLTLEHNNLK